MGEQPMQEHHGPVDVCIVGAGAGGSVLAAELAEAGAAVVALEAGEWVRAEDMVNDELAMAGRLEWDEPRLVDSDDPVVAAGLAGGRGVGGGTPAYTGLALRLHGSDFRLHSQDGVAVDWPLTYRDLAPHYEAVERALCVSGPFFFPWGEYHGPYPLRPFPRSCRDEKTARGMAELGIRAAVAPRAALSSEAEGRPGCSGYGFCNLGCRADAKSSAAVTYLRRAVEAGAEIRTGCHAARVNLSPGGLARAVTYFDREGREQEQEAGVVCLCGSAIETPRLLLGSTSSIFPDGLANSSGQVGRNLMMHVADSVYARFDDPIDAFAMPQVGICSQDSYESDRARGFLRGWTTYTWSLLPIGFATTLALDHPDLWGSRMVELMRDYSHFLLLGIIGETLPRADNRVTLANDRDRFGLPLPRIAFTLEDNAERLRAAAVEQSKQIAEAAGANFTMPVRRYQHVMGTCRMGREADSSVVDPWCRAHDVDNLYIVDGSVLPTIGAVPPGLTIQALATRTAAHLTTRVRQGELGLAHA